jgi:hypothetical protein
VEPVECRRPGRDGVWNCWGRAGASRRGRVAPLISCVASSESEVESTELSGGPGIASGGPGIVSGRPRSGDSRSENREWREQNREWRHRDWNWRRQNAVGHQATGNGTDRDGFGSGNDRDCELRSRHWNFLARVVSIVGETGRIRIASGESQSALVQRARLSRDRPVHFSLARIRCARSTIAMRETRNNSRVLRRESCAARSSWWECSRASLALSQRFPVSSLRRSLRCEACGRHPPRLVLHGVPGVHGLRESATSTPLNTEPPPNAVSTMEAQ